jgi:hypothetical protein
MRIWHGALLLAALTIAIGIETRATAPGEPQGLTPTGTTAVEEGVRAFARAVAHDVTKEGPAARRRHLSDSPSFFMASEGQLVFPNRAAATAAIQNLEETIKQIELKWGDDLRIDPLTKNLAVVATSYHEVRVSTDGLRIEENGFFTGIAEYRGGRWQFRNAHWSVIAPPVAAH